MNRTNTQHFGYKHLRKFEIFLLTQKSLGRNKNS